MHLGFFSLSPEPFAVETDAFAYRHRSLYSTLQRVEGSDMKRVMVALMVLLVAGLIVSASGAFSMPTSLSGLNIPSLSSSVSGLSTPSSSLSGLSSPSSSLGSFSTPSSDMQVSTPASTAFSDWNLNNMEFFSPDNRATAQQASSIPASDLNAIMNSLGQLPTSDQMSQYYGGGTATATPTPTNNTDTFITNVSSTIPADQVIFIEAAQNTMLLDPTNQGIIIPNVTMNYKFSDSAKKLVLKKKAGVDYNASQLYFGYANSDDVNNRYVYDYAIGSSTGISIQVLFAGADGRLRIKVNGVTKDLMPGTKYESITNEGNQRIVLDVTNWGLVPKANIEVADTI
jgi:hypothetical protein